ncbi:hypothetical protein V6N13_048566 [Hibiscus sabdariffa]|uniref:Uncharacterized protein n=1 Tax=Hibiscus sabdariffa TaxID=183260 RepID=A0ABR2F7K1_9ROSI
MWGCSEFRRWGDSSLVCMTVAKVRCGCYRFECYQNSFRDLPREIDKLVYNIAKVRFGVFDDPSSSMAMWLARDVASRNELFKAWL